MSKILDILQKQLSSEYKEDAKEVLKVYNAVLKITGHIWNSDWCVLVNTGFIPDASKHWSNRDRKYYLTPIGKVFLKGLENETL